MLAVDKRRRSRESPPAKWTSQRDRTSWNSAWQTKQPSNYQTPPWWLKRGADWLKNNKQEQRKYALLKFSFLPFRSAGKSARTERRAAYELLLLSVLAMNSIMLDWVNVSDVDVLKTRCAQKKRRAYCGDSQPEEEGVVRRENRTEQNVLLLYDLLFMCDVYSQRFLCEYIYILFAHKREYAYFYIYA